MRMRSNLLVCLSLGAVLIGAEGCDEPIDADADLDLVGVEQKGAEDDEEAAAIAAEGEEAEADENAANALPVPLRTPPRESEASTVWHFTTKSCVSTGGGTWGSILTLCLSLWCNQNGTEGNQFTVTKTDGTTFTTPGTFYLRRDSKTGTTLNSKKYYKGNSASSLSDDLYKSIPLNGSVDYYAYLAADGGGYAWVGPLKVYEKAY